MRAARQSPSSPYKLDKGRTDERRDGATSERTDGQTDGRPGGQKIGLIGQMKRWSDGITVGQTDGRADTSLTCKFGSARLKKEETGRRDL